TSGASSQGIKIPQRVMAMYQSQRAKKAHEESEQDDETPKPTPHNPIAEHQVFQEENQQYTMEIPDPNFADFAHLFMDVDPGEHIAPLELFKPIMAEPSSKLRIPGYNRAISGILKPFEYKFIHLSWTFILSILGATQGQMTHIR